MKGWFTPVKKTFHIVLAVLGILLPFVDVYQTLIGLELGREGNPLINLTPSELQFSFLIITHVLLSVLSIVLGWKGYAEENMPYRAFLSLLVVALLITAVMNALLMI
jgi:hypothetical protein